MKRDYIDFHFVEPHQIAIHDRLINWARYVKPHGLTVQMAPIWCLGKSNTRQWHAPEPRIEVDILDGMKLEKAVCALPHVHKGAIRWAYVFPTKPTKACAKLGLSEQGLLKAIRDGRQMLLNRIRESSEAEIARYNPPHSASEYA